MFATKEVKKQTKGFAPSSRKQTSRERSDSTKQIDYLSGSTISQQRYLGNSYLQYITESPQTLGQHNTHSGLSTISQDFSHAGFSSCYTGKKGESSKIQTKLTIGPANDVYEQEADRVAEQVMRMPDSSIRAQDQPNVGINIQRISASGGNSLESDHGIQLNQNGGSPLSTPTRTFMEPRFGIDFGHVRLHTDQQAHQTASRIQARAFTYRNHIWLGKGAGETDKGLIVHELTHVIQQGATTQANDAESSSGSGGLKESDETTGDTEPDIEYLYANGTTTCVFPGGLPSSTVTNPNCSAVCTGEHEAQHYSDISPCCAAAGLAYRAAPASDKPGIRTQFFTWLNANRRYFECRAYAVSVVCADREIAAKDCNGTPSPADTACCTHLAAYRTDKASRMVSNCAGGPSLSACPFS